MQRLFNLIMMSAMASGLFLMTSCGEDDPVANAPDVVLDSTSASLYPGQMVTVAGTATADAGIVSITATVDAGTPETVFSSTDTVGTKEFAYEFTVPADAPAGDITITITVTDDLGQSGTVDFTVTVKEGVAANSYTTVLLGGRYNATEPSFYNAIENIRYKQSEFTGGHAVHTDFLYFHGATYKATLASPTDTGADEVFSGVLSGTANINETLFKATDLTAADFDAIGFEHEILAHSFEVGGATHQQQLAVGDVMVIQLDASRGGKYGLVKVVEIAGSTLTSNESITIDVKMQP